MFMRANIVGTVIVLSLIIWIPASCIVAAIVRIQYILLIRQYQLYSSNWCYHIA